MKRIIVCYVLMLQMAYGMTMVSYAGLRPVQFNVQVVDEAGGPVEGAQISCTFYKWGRGGGLEDHKNVVRQTGTNGIVAFSGRSIGMIFWQAQKPGHYISNGEYKATNVVNGKLEPWGETYQMVLRKIENPIPMYANQVRDTVFPSVNNDFGFDLMAGDWVAPYGKGHDTDIILRLDYEEFFRGGRRPDFDAHLRFSFPNEGDGIQVITGTDAFAGSVFQLPRYAPLEGWEKGYAVRMWGGDIPGTSRKNGLEVEGNDSVFFRVRTKLDEKGNVVSALYGKMRPPIRVNNISRNGAMPNFTYYLNPTPNDRNMEFDPERNLLEGGWVREP